MTKKKKRHQPIVDPVLAATARPRSRQAGSPPAYPIRCEMKPTMMYYGEKQCQEGAQQQDGTRHSLVRRKRIKGLVSRSAGSLGSRARLSFIPASFLWSLITPGEAVVSESWVGLTGIASDHSSLGARRRRRELSPVECRGQEVRGWATACPVSSNGNVACYRRASPARADRPRAGPSILGQRRCSPTANEARAPCSLRSVARGPLDRRRFCARDRPSISTATTIGRGWKRSARAAYRSRDASILHVTPANGRFRELLVQPEADRSSACHRTPLVCSELFG